MITKTCTVCERVLPATPEFFWRDKKGKYGIKSKCKKCLLERDREGTRFRHIKNRDKDLKRKREYYQQNKERKNFLSKIHQYIRKIKGKQIFCSICNEKKILELASINYTYTKDLNDYIWLCRSCHLLFDRTNKTHLKGEDKDVKM